MIRCFCLWILLSLGLSAPAVSNLKSFNKKANAFFRAHVQSGRVDYRILKMKHEKELQDLVQEISGIDHSALHGKVLKSYLINAYNILVIHQAVLRYRGFPESEKYDEIIPCEEPGFYSNKIQDVGGKRMSLNELKEILMERGKDLRVFSLLSPATMGGPVLSSYAYKPLGLNHHLKQGMKRISDDRNFVRKINKPPLILFSDIFLGYDHCFSKEEMITALNKYREEALPLDVEIKFFPAGCNLNEK